MFGTYRKLAPGPLIVASHNAGKLREIAALVRPLGIEPLSAADLGLPEPEETGDSYRANAELKALAAARPTGMPALADDSGLSVEALGGAPGIFSARWAGEPRDFGLAMERVEAALREAGPGASRRAAFVCGLALAWPDGHIEYFEGRVEGSLVWPPRGTRGFGYDPMFVAEGHTLTFGEMDPEAKHAISHRARAFDRLVRACISG
jgi:XTP/dITP diphosphohydrolase